MLRPLLHSYSMLFFSQHRGLGWLLLLASFARPEAGVAGLAAAALAVGGARLLGFRRDYTDLGAYSFNALLVGLLLPLYFAPGWALAALVALGAGVALLLSVALGGWLGGRGLPFLSLPFVLTSWGLLLAGRHLPQLLPAEPTTFWLSGSYALGGARLAATWRWAHELSWSPGLGTYLRALSGVLLQDSPWAGLLVAVGLLWHSRIAFSLSVLAFAGAWALASLTGTDGAYDLGANYIMAAVAVGAVFALPSPGSYALALLSLPVTALLLAATGTLLAGNAAGLPALSLPYCGTALLLLYALLLRERVPAWLRLTPLQRYSPEANLYADLARPDEQPAALPLALPFVGEWRCTQGYLDGGPTHQGPWGQALDFVITDDEGRPHQGRGLTLSDYYCYGKPVLAPADGVVEEVLDYLPDNPVGEVDTQRNWGNTVVLRHAPGLYSQLSHLQTNSARVRVGQAVRRGDVLAACGSSGRSPAPHLHFQLQAAPAIGSPTLAYPLAAFLAGAVPVAAPHRKSALLAGLAAAPAGPTRHTGPALTAEVPAAAVADWQLSAQPASLRLRTHTVPLAGEVVRPASPLPLLARALGFAPGVQLVVRRAELPEAAPQRWDVATDAYNHRYLRCATTGAVAYFEVQEAVVQFTAYYGPRGTWLHALYLAAYRVPLCWLPQPTQATLPLSAVQGAGLGWLHDVVAPFGQFAQARTELGYPAHDPGPTARRLTLHSCTTLAYFGHVRPVQQAELLLEENHLRRLTVRQPGETLTLLFDYPAA